MEQVRTIRTASLVAALLTGMVGCDINTVRAVGPTHVAVGGHAGYSLVTDTLFDGCDPYSRPRVCVPSPSLGLPKIERASSNAPQVIDIVEVIEGVSAIAVAGSPGRATLTLTGADRISRSIEVEAVEASRSTIELVGCESRALPVGSTQCFQMHVFSGQQELAGGKLDVTIAGEGIQPLANDGNLAAQNTRCFAISTVSGSTTVAGEFRNTRAEAKHSYYDLTQVERIHLAITPATDSYSLYDNSVFLRRTLLLNGETVCESSATSSEPSVWHTAWVSNTPEVCSVTLQGDSQRTSTSTATNVYGTAPGLCEVTATLGNLSESIRIEFEQPS